MLQMLLFERLDSLSNGTYGCGRRRGGGLNPSRVSRPTIAGVIQTPSDSALLVLKPPFATLNLPATVSVELRLATQHDSKFCLSSSNSFELSLLPHRSEESPMLPRRHSRSASSRDNLGDRVTEGGFNFRSTLDAIFDNPRVIAPVQN
jgi:hypothetical protein